MKIATMLLFLYLFLVCGGLALWTRYKRSVMAVTALWSITVGSALHVLGIVFIPGFDYEIPPAALLMVLGVVGFFSLDMWSRRYAIWGESPCRRANDRAPKHLLASKSRT